MIEGKAPVGNRPQGHGQAEETQQGIGFETLLGAVKIAQDHRLDLAAAALQPVELIGDH